MMENKFLITISLVFLCFNCAFSLEISKNISEGLNTYYFKGNTFVNEEIVFLTPNPEVFSFYGFIEEDNSILIPKIIPEGYKIISPGDGIILKVVKYEGISSSFTIESRTLFSEIEPLNLELNVNNQTGIDSFSHFVFNSSLINTGGIKSHSTSVRLITPPNIIVTSNRKQNIGVLEPGESKVISWYLLIDSEGDYNVSVQADSDSYNDFYSVIKNSYIHIVDDDTQGPSIHVLNESSIPSNNANINAYIYDLSEVSSANITYKINGFTNSTSLNLQSGTHWNVSLGNLSDYEGLYLSYYITAVDSDNTPAMNHSVNYTSIITDDDLIGPNIINVIIKEYDGNNDGVIQTNERVEILWNANDPSGIKNITISVDDSDLIPVNNSFITNVSYVPGDHSFSIFAYDHDNSPAISCYNGGFTSYYSDVGITGITVSNKEINPADDVIIKANITNYGILSSTITLGLSISSSQLVQNLVPAEITIPPLSTVSHAFIWHSDRAEIPGNKVIEVNIKDLDQNLSNNKLSRNLLVLGDAFFNVTGFKNITSCIPGENCSLDFIISNEGLLSDDYAIDVIGIPGVWLDYSNIVKINPNLSESVNINLLIPESSIERDYYYSLKISSVSSPKDIIILNGELRILKNIEIYGCMLNLTDKNNKLSIKSSGTNTGNSESNFNIIIDLLKNGRLSSNIDNKTFLIEPNQDFMFNTDLDYSDISPGNYTIFLRILSDDNKTLCLKSNNIAIIKEYDPGIMYDNNSTLIYLNTVSVSDEESSQDESNNSNTEISGLAVFEIENENSYFEGSALFLIIFFTVTGLLAAKFIILNNKGINESSDDSSLERRSDGTLIWRD